MLLLLCLCTMLTGQPLSWNQYRSTELWTRWLKWNRWNLKQCWKTTIHLTNHIISRLTCDSMTDKAPKPWKISLIRRASLHWNKPLSACLKRGCQPRTGRSLSQKTYDLRATLSYRETTRLRLPLLPGLSYRETTRLRLPLLPGWTPFSTKGCVPATSHVSFLSFVCQIVGGCVIWLGSDTIGWLGSRQMPWNRRRKCSRAGVIHSWERVENIPVVVRVVTRMLYSKVDVIWCAGSGEIRKAGEGCKGGRAFGERYRRPLVPWQRAGSA